MRRIVPALVDLAAGLVFVAIALFAARVLLQSRLLVYVCFPLLCTAALVVGFRRGGLASHRGDRRPGDAAAVSPGDELLLRTQPAVHGVSDRRRHLRRRRSR